MAAVPSSSNTSSAVREDEVEILSLIRDEKHASYHQATCRGGLVMIKICKLSKSIDPHFVKKRKRQLEQIHRVRHQNILLCMGMFEMKNKNLAIVTEQVETSLSNYILDQAIPLSLSKRLLIARDCASGLTWMHQGDHPSAHGDISPKHFYFDRHQKEMKLCELGWDRELNPQHSYNIRFTAPEVLKGHHPTLKSDIYSFGMILLFIVTRTLPYSAEYPNDDDLRPFLLSHPNSTPSVDGLATNVGRLILACLLFKPADRPSFRQISKVMDVVLIDTSIADPSGKKFWRKHFFQRDDVLWKEIESTLWQCYLPTHVMVDTTSHNLQIKQQINKMLLYFHGALTEMSQRKSAGDEQMVISMERLGFVLQYFGPLLTPSGEAMLFLTRLYEVLSEDWFFGSLDQTRACGFLSREPLGTFLVRYSSSTPGYFTISIKCGEGVSDGDFAHVRIQHDPCSEHFSIQGRQYDSLPKLINCEKKGMYQDTMPCTLGKSCPGSTYTFLRLEEKELVSLGYMS